MTNKIQLVTRGHTDTLVQAQSAMAENKNISRLSGMHCFVIYVYNNTMTIHVHVHNYRVLGNVGFW